MQPIAVQHIEIRQTRTGDERAFIAGTRIRVTDVYVLADVQGKSPDEIVAAYPHLTLGQVHAALGYCFDHREQVVQQLRDDEAFVESMKQATGPGPFAKN